MTPLEIELDYLYSALNKNKKCYYHSQECWGRLENHHDLNFLRKDKVYRYDYRNSMRVCIYHHDLIHKKKIPDLQLKFEKITIKDYKARENISYIEFLEIKKQELTEELKRQGIDSTKIKVYKKIDITKTAFYKKAQELRRIKWKEVYQLKKKNKYAK